MPMLPEAIEDTLTDRAIDLMRALKVTPEMHSAAAHASSGGTPIEHPDDDTSEPGSLAFPDRIPAGGIAEITFACTPVVRAAALSYDGERGLGYFVTVIAAGRASTESLGVKRTLAPTAPVNKALPSILQRSTGRRPQVSR
jgi:hypothetical protein